MLAVFATACGSTVTKLEPTSPDQSGASHPRYRIECIELDQCKKRAVAACGPKYEVVSVWKNTIPESELPGLNEQSRPKDAWDWNHGTLPSATGIESREPMKVARIVVSCTG